MNTSRSLVIFFQDYFPLIQRKCTRMLGDSDEAADVAQETFVRLWSSPLVSDTSAARLAWIYRTSTRLAIDSLRRQQLGVEVRGDDDALDRGAMADKVIEAREWLSAIVHLLPEEDLEVLVLSRLDGMTLDEVARATSMSPRSVRRVLERIEGRFESLRERLK